MKILLIMTAAALYLSILYFGSPQQNNNNMADNFNKFKQTFNKKYGQAEEQYRFVIYSQNMMEIQKHNSNPDASWQMGETQFSDLTQQEFISKYLTLKTQEQPNPNEEKEYVGVPTEDNVDWRKHKGVATKVKDQGQCGSCWAFSTIGAIEGFYATLKFIKDLDLSEQQLVDCSKENYGCDGGWPQKALTWVAENGLTDQTEYPYVARQETCRMQSGDYHINGPLKVASTVNSLKSAIAKRPVSVCVDASNWFQYKSGVLDECGEYINHAVLGFGYSHKYWIIKNSWSTLWGEQGYIRLAMGNTCNVLSESYLAA